MVRQTVKQSIPKAFLHCSKNNPLAVNLNQDKLLIFRSEIYLVALYGIASSMYTKRALRFNIHLF